MFDSDFKMLTFDVIWIDFRQRNKTLNKKGGYMNDSLTNYGVLEPVQIHDQEFENQLNECKTEEERDEIINQCVATRLFSIVAILVILFAIGVIVSAFVYIFRLFSR